MRNLRKAFARSLSLMVTLAIGSVAAPAATGSQPAEVSEAALSPAELYSLYHGRTWIWPSGGAYFSPQPRSFVAWSRSEKGDSYANGKWIITYDGQVCFKADWHSRNGVAPALSCFGHKRAGKTIYQRRLPGGKWYVFRSPRQGETQEYSNFKLGDEATAAAGSVKLSLEAAGD